MNNIAPIGRPAAATTVPNPDAVNTPPTKTGHQRADDQVELSTAAQLLSRRNTLPDVREEMVARVREEILADTYETPEKFDAVVAELQQDLEDLP